MKETIKINNIKFVLGNKYLYKVVGDDNFKIMLKANDRESVKKVFATGHMTFGQEWQEIANIVSRYEV